MSETKKLTQEELASIKEIDNKNKQLIVAFGEIESQIIQLQDRKDKLKEEMMKLILEEREVVNSLQTKYGAVKINLEDGTITE